MVDPRKVVGNIVIAKACHITSLAECARRYGANKQTKTLEGVVVDVIVERSDPGKKGATKIVADYDLGGGVIKRASINIRSIKAKEVQNVVVGLRSKMFKMQWVVFNHLRSNANLSNEMPLIQQS